MMLTGHIDVGSVALFVLVVGALVILKRAGVISPDEWLRDLAAEAKELVQLKMTTGAINFATILVIALIVGLYFIVPEMAGLLDNLSPNHVSTPESGKTALFIVTVALVLITLLLCLMIQKSK